MRILLFSLLMLLAFAAPADAQSNPKIKLVTSMGEIVMELDAGKAPTSTANMVQYVKDGFYDGLIFHRVIDGFMIQAGGLDKDMNLKKGRAPIKNEADNGLKNLAYTVALARTGDPDSATSQFFINVKDNAGLDHKEKSVRGWGYAVIGKVIQGKEVVDKIKDVKTTSKAGHENVPVEPITILKAELVP